VSGGGQTIGLSVIDLDPSLSELEDLSSLHCHSPIADTALSGRGAHPKACRYE
jgi:hypothetical protein